VTALTHHDVRGDGPPVLLVHAGIADSRMWAALAERLVAAGHRVITCDLRGHGRTPLAPGVVSNAGDLLALLDALGIERAAVVGASFGGRVALELAVARPELVQRLVLVGAGLGAWEWSDLARSGFAEEEQAFERGDLAAAAAAQARLWLADDAAADVRALTEEMTLLSYELQMPVEDEVSVRWPEPGARERLHEIAVPTLVVVGSEDVPDMIEIADLLTAQIPAARRETIEGAGHLPSLERPEALSRLLLEFV
jgi:3-oxoadipate enol-lactonase